MSIQGDHDWLGIAGLAVGIIGVISGVYFYLRSRRTIQISFTIGITQLLGKDRGVLPEEITISYRGDPIKNLVKANAIL